MRQFFKNRRNRVDLYHVSVPFILALLMAPSSIAGALSFLIIWSLMRWAFHV